MEEPREAGGWKLDRSIRCDIRGTIGGGLRSSTKRSRQRKTKCKETRQRTGPIEGLKESMCFDICCTMLRTQALRFVFLEETGEKMSRVGGYLQTSVIDNILIQLLYKVRTRGLEGKVSGSNNIFLNVATRSVPLKGVFPN